MLEAFKIRKDLGAWDIFLRDLISQDQQPSEIELFTPFTSNL